MAVVLDLLVLTLALQTLQSPATALPEFDASKPSVVTLYEKETTVTTLSTENCTDPGNSPTVSLTSVTPTTPCGQVCFQVLPCGTEWCVIFFPSMGTLDYRKASAYYVTVTCTANGSSVNKTINVRLTPNTPPIFNPDVSFQTTTLTNTKNVKAGTKIFTVGAVDDNNDTIIYTMTSEPQSSNFQIGSGTGVITAVHDLSSQCSNSITFHVYISDGINPRVGPQDIIVTLSDPNASPDITNLDRSVQVLESKAVGDSIVTFTPTDEATKQLTYTLSADPPSNLAFFDISGQDIVVKSTLNYETVATRTTNLTVVTQDASGCTSQPHYLYVTVTDVNEMPQLYPKNAVYTTYEGSITVQPSWTVKDEDFVDTRTYSIIGGNSLNRFRIDPNTGEISSNVDYDVDGGAMPTTVTLTVKVTDKGGLSDNTTVTLNILDSNDNRPVVINGPYDYTVQPCNVRAGRTLGTMVCQDKDSSFQGNNDTYFSSSGGTGLTILASGAIILKDVPPEGTTYTVTVYCNDRGQYPNPLQSLAPTIVSVTGIECQTTTAAPPVTAAPKTAAPTTTTTSTTTTTPAPSTANTKSWVDENLPWIMIAALLTTGLLGLLAYLLARYCWPACLRCCRGRWCQSRPPRPQVRRNVTPAPLPPPTPPPPVIGSPDAYLYDFWKERYPDDDYGKQPNRQAPPLPVDSVPQEDGGFKSVGQPLTSSKKSRTCNIL